MAGWRLLAANHSEKHELQVQGETLPQRRKVESDKDTRCPPLTSTCLHLYTHVCLHHMNSHTKRGMEMGRAVKDRQK